MLGMSWIYTLSRWYIASLHIYHFSTVIDFSSKRYIVSTGHRYSWCQQRRNDKWNIMMQYTIRIRKLNSLTWWLLSVWIWQGHNWKMIIKFPAADWSSQNYIYMHDVSGLTVIKICSVFTLNVIYHYQVSNDSNFWATCIHALFLCGFCNRKLDELPVLYLRVSSTIKAHNQ